MKTTKDKYNFEQSSPRGQFGFEVFKNKDENKYYFHFNNREGRTVLFSQAYASARSRDNGLNSVQSNATDIDRFAFHDKKGKHYFTLVAGNNQEIARSQLFDTKKEMEAALNSIVQLASQKATAQTLKSQEVEKAEASETTSHEKTNETVAQTKSRITIDFYRNKSGEPLKGRIEHPLSGDKVKFQGYDRQVILRFIEQHIPAGEKQEAPLPSVIKAQVEEDLTGLYTTSEGLKTQYLRPGSSLEIVIPLPAETADFKQYNLEVYAKQLGNNQRQVLGKESAALPKEARLTYAIAHCPLKKGTYRLLIHLFLKTGNEQQQAETLTGSCLLLVQ